MTNENKISKPKREKGSNLLEIKNDYVVIDIETTGFSSDADDILELSAVKVISNKIIDKFSFLIKPNNFTAVSPIIENLTGISTEMILKNGRDEETVLREFYAFINDNIIIGHNVNFDINFLYDRILDLTSKKLQNDFIDTYRLAKWYAFPEEEKYTLMALSNSIGIPATSYHRSEADAYTTFLLYQKIIEKLGSDWKAPVVHSSLNATKIIGDHDKINVHNPLYNAHVVFTGNLAPLTRRDAMQIVADLGGIPENTVTKNTNFLVTGVQDPTQIKGLYSKKQEKALKYQKLGQDIHVIDSIVFSDMISDYEEN